MSEIITFPLPAGPNFTIPDVGEINWGQAVTDFLVALPNGVPPTAGTFSLTGDLSFGSSFGLVTKYFKSISPNIASTGSFRLAHGDAIAFRNFANSGDLLLAVDNSDNITFNGATFGISGAVNPGTANTLGYYATSSDAISSLPAITASRALVSNASGLPVASTVTSTTLAFMDATSSVQTQINSVVTTANAALPKAGGTMSGAINMGTTNKITNMADGTVSTDAATFGQVSSATTPPGVITMYGAASAPSGWLLCNGAAVSRTTYAALFAVIGTNFGVGDGSSTFNVPSMANNVPIGAGSIAALGATAGSQTHSITTSEMPTHNHGVTDPGHSHSLRGNTVNAADNAVTLQAAGAISLDAGSTHPGTEVYDANNANGVPWVQASTTGVTTNNAGSGTAMSLVQPVLGVTFIIKT